MRIVFNILSRDFYVHKMKSTLQKITAAFYQSYLKLYLFTRRGSDIICDHTRYFQTPDILGNHLPEINIYSPQPMKGISETFTKMVDAPCRLRMRFCLILRQREPINKKYIYKKCIIHPSFS